MAILSKDEIRNLGNDRPKVRGVEHRDYRYNKNLHGKAVRQWRPYKQQDTFIDYRFICSELAKYIKDKYLALKNLVEALFELGLIYNNLDKHKFLIEYLCYGTVWSHNNILYLSGKVS